MSVYDFLQVQGTKRSYYTRKEHFSLRKLIYSDLLIEKGRLIYICEYMWQKVISTFLEAKDQSITRWTKDQEL